ncbi:MAG: DUF4338 domain-containing protein [Ignavibacteriales bacterium]|nr:DUF4338 domain-containing protein [Ignavibacteriales bacterium]
MSSKEKSTNALTEADLVITDALLNERYSKSRHSKDFLRTLEWQYKEWLCEQRNSTKERIPKEYVRERLIAELSKVAKMSTEEHTLYRKWDEIGQHNTVAGWKALLEDKEFEKNFTNDKSFRDSLQLYFAELSSKPPKSNGKQPSEDDELEQHTDADESFVSSVKSYLSRLSSLARKSVRERMRGFQKACPDRPSVPFDALQSYKKIEETKRYQWRQNSWDEFAITGVYSDDPSEGEIIPAICPEVIQCTNDATLSEYWNILRTLTSTMINNSNIGRDLRFIVRDANSGNTLGVFALSSDFLDMTARDEYIGWSREARTQDNGVNHIAIASTAVPMQPFGYNYCGGKLIALMAISDVAERAWNDSYDSKDELCKPSKLVGVTTTSLYSSFSQYTRLPYWKHVGHTTGTVKRPPCKEVSKLAEQYLKQEYPREYWEFFVAREPGGMPLKRDHKQRSLTFILKKLDIDRKLYENPGDERGIYFCNLFDNSREFLRGEICEDELIRRQGFDNSVEALTNLWKDKFAVKRIEKLLSEGRVSHEELCYDELAFMSWEQTKAKYLQEVGR